MTVTVTSIDDLRSILKPLRADSTIALVPTMGNLHTGHLELVKLAKQQSDIVVVSIFVNPTQFGVGEDLGSYPRTLDADVQKLTSMHVDYVFTPTVADMYPVLPPPTQVLSGNVSQGLCGKTRPTHFDGVGIVVTKLFNIVQPDVAVFGQKDFQQLTIIKQLVRDLSYDINIISAPIIRNTDGLALSSRNQYLTDTERQLAATLHREVSRLATRLTRGEHVNAGTPQDLSLIEGLIKETVKRIEKVGFTIDYLEVVKQDLTGITDVTKDRNLLIATAAWLGKARLLDNEQVTVDV